MNQATKVGTCKDSKKSYRQKLDVAPLLLQRASRGRSILHRTCASAAVAVRLGQLALLSARASRRSSIPILVILAAGAQPRRIFLWLFLRKQHLAHQVLRHARTHSCA